MWNSTQLVISPLLYNSFATFVTQTASATTAAWIATVCCLHKSQAVAMAARLLIFIKMHVKALCLVVKQRMLHTASCKVCAPNSMIAYNVSSSQRGGYTVVWGRATRTAHAAAI